jgi:hypothetical protein
MAGEEKIDWEEMEPDWRAGIISKKQLSKQYGVSRAAIDKHWAKLGIERDLAAVSPTRVKVVLPPSDHLDTAGFVYVIYLDDSAQERFYKIGMAKHFSARFDTHQCASPFDVCVACAYFVANMRDEEQFLHRTFQDKRLRGEWFRLNHDDLWFVAQRGVLV